MLVHEIYEYFDRANLLAEVLFEIKLQPKSWSEAV